MKIKGKQVEYTAAEAQALLSMAGLTPTLLEQLQQAAAEQVVTLQEVENTEGVVTIDRPANGVCYRVLYPTVSIVVGEVAENATLWIEFCCGLLSESTTFALQAAQDIYFLRSTSEPITPMSAGSYYQIKITNRFGRLYAEFMGTTILAPIMEEEEEQ